MDVSRPANVGALGQYREPDANSAKNLVSAAAKKAGVDVEAVGVQNLRAKDFTNALYAESIRASIEQFSVQMQLSDGSTLSANFLKIEASWARQSGDSELLGHLQGLTPAKAKSLVAEDGYFGAAQTADRIAGFVINGAGDDVEKLKAGRAGVIKGYQEAGKMLGFNGGAGALGEATSGAKSLAQDTISRALEAIDKRIAELGGKVLDVQA